MKGMLRAGAVILVLGMLVVGSQSWSAPKAKPQGPRTRVAVFNMTSVIKGYEKYQKVQDEIKNIIKEYQDKDKDLRAHGERLKKQLEDKELAEEKREEAEKKIKKIQQEIEENSDEAKKVLGKKSDKSMVEIYTAIRKATQEYAKEHDIDLVLHYNDAMEEAELNNPLNVARKMQASACTPIGMGNHVDITADIIVLMNKKLGEL